MKLVIYGAGDAAKRYLAYRNNKEIDIVAVVDSDGKKQGKKIGNYLIQTPETIKDIEWDYIWISPYDKCVFQGIKQKLQNDYGVSEEKIMCLDEVILGKKKDTYLPCIYDCFIFFNELELLELRLRLLNDVVDYFVIVEMEVTHTGKKKEFIFEQNRERFSAYKDKIIYIKKLDSEMPQRNLRMWGEMGRQPVDWTYESYQRDAILEGLEGASEHDVIIVSDVDEFPNPIILQQVKDNADLPNRNIYSQLLTVGPITLEFDMYMTYLNCQLEQKWIGSLIALKKYITSPNELRFYRTIFPLVSDGGWHLSWMGDKERLVKKINAVSEGEGCTGEEKNEIIRDLLKGKGMPSNGSECKIVDMEDITFPLAKAIYEEKRLNWFCKSEGSE